MHHFLLSSYFVVLTNCGLWYVSFEAGLLPVANVSSCHFFLSLQNYCQWISVFSPSVILLNFYFWCFRLLFWPTSLSWVVSILSRYFPTTFLPLTASHSYIPSSHWMNFHFRCKLVMKTLSGTLIVTLSRAKASFIFCFNYGLLANFFQLIMFTRFLSNVFQILYKIMKSVCVTFSAFHYVLNL